MWALIFGSEAKKQKALTLGGDTGNRFGEGTNKRRRTNQRGGGAGQKTEERIVRALWERSARQSHRRPSEQKINPPTGRTTGRPWTNRSENPLSLEAPRRRGKGPCDGCKVRPIRGKQGQGWGKILRNVKRIKGGREKKQQNASNESPKKRGGGGGANSGRRSKT